MKPNNSALLNYVKIYENIENNFHEQIASFGLPMQKAADIPVARLLKAGVRIENANSSFWLNKISPACVSCRKGVEMSTYFISMKCSKKCYFCFNPNQEGFDYYRVNLRNAAKELENEHASGRKYTHLALSGGEPLLHKSEAYLFLGTARKLYPDIYLRLYTCGDFLDEKCLETLRSFGLNEIRFSLKTESGVDALEDMYKKIALSKNYIPSVMVEMPVFPNQIEEMKAIFYKLDLLGIDGINLLELCFPFFNEVEFYKRGYRLKMPAYRVLYDYIYSGGLPVAGSEEVCFELLLYAAENSISMGVHYCSLENKFTGQIYQQNCNYKGLAVMDEDSFLKSAKVFGDDVHKMEKILKSKGIKQYIFNKDYGYLEFPLKYASLAGDTDVFVSYQIVELRNKKEVIRELKVVKA